MNARGWLSWALVAIGTVTIVTGVVQIIAPRWVLERLSAETTPASLHFFAIVGMFMVLFGGLLLHSLVSTPAPPVPLLWAALQKFGASAAVAMGVMNDVFSQIALIVAVFDFVSGGLVIWYWLSLRAAK
jgi:hypothetical protein